MLWIDGSSSWLECWVNDTSDDDEKLFIKMKIKIK
jgi:hypothetical protein